MTTINTRIVNKHDLEAVWLSKADFIPLQGELIIYDCEIDKDGVTLALPAGRTTPYTYERFKIGDGKTSVNDLPFAGGNTGDDNADVSAQLATHNTDTTAHGDIRLSINNLDTRLDTQDARIDNSAMFDKSFGIGPDTVAEGDHTHGDLQLQLQSIEEIINAGYYDTSASAEFFTDITPSHTVWAATSSSKVTDVDIIGGRYVCTTNTVDHGLKTENLTDLIEVVKGKTLVAAANLSSDNYTLYIKMNDGTAWSFGKIKSTDKIVTFEVPENLTQFKFGLEYKGDGSTPETCEVTNFAVYLVNDVIMTSTANIPNRNYTIWSWNDEEIINPEAFAAFCNAYKINRVYQHISTSTVSLEDIRKFVGTMQKNRVSVNWLTGDPSWALAAHHYHIVDQIQKVVSYNMSIQNDYEKIGTIQFDIEPYTLSEWETDQASVVKQYQDAIVLMYNESLAKQLSLNVCIASWFDGVTYDNEYGQGNLFDFVSKHSSSTVIMAYNTSGYVSIAEDEIRMGAANGKNVAVGLETHVIDDSVTEDITFANKPIEDLYRAFETLFLVYKMYGVYKGYEFVIHDYAYFKAYAESFNLTVESNDILGKLNTEDKTDLISAINEINTEVESLKTSVEDVLNKHNGQAIEKVLLYYGYPIAINGVWSVEGAVNIYRNYDVVVLGDEYQSSDHPEHESTAAIIQRLLEVAPNTRIVGYVPIGMVPDSLDSNLPMEELKARVDEWTAMGVHGIFLDEFGYDYYVTRERQNEIVNYCHELGKFVFANSWSVKYCFGSEPMVLDWLDNFEPNPNSIEPVLNENDYYLYENLFYTTEEIEEDVYDIECASVWRIDDVFRYYTQPVIDGKSYFEKYGTKICSLDGLPSTYSEAQLNVMKSISIIGAFILNITSIAFGNEDWGASGSFNGWDLPDLDLTRKGLNGVTVETKTYIKEDGTESSFPYKWTTQANGHTYSIVFDVPDPDYRTWVDGMRYATIDGSVVENVWTNVYSFQSDVREAQETAEAAITAAEEVKKEIEDVLPSLDRLESGLAELEGLTSGFGFKEVQW